MRRGRININNQLQDKQRFYELINRMMVYFNVTKTTVIYKLKELNFLNDQSEIKTIGQLINEHTNDFFI